MKNNDLRYWQNQLNWYEQQNQYLGQQQSQYQNNLLAQLGMGQMALGLQPTPYVPPPAPVRIRCSYCAVKVRPEDIRCESCGAPL
jgi:hypothetical protein